MIDELTKDEWDKLPPLITIDCGPGEWALGALPPRGYIDVTCMDDVFDNKRVFMKGLFPP